MMHYFNKNISNKKISYLVILTLLLISSKTTVFMQSDITLLLVSVLFVLIFIHQKLKIDKYFITIFILYTISIPIYLFIFGYVEIIPSLGLFLRILIAYLAIKISSRNFLTFIINAVYILTFISLPLFLIQLIFNDFLFQINSIFKTAEYYEYSNSLIFNINPGALSRNSGFMWEPGAFGAILCIIILFRLIQTNFLLKDKVLIILILGLITTFSTTGYLVLILLVLFILVNKFERQPKVTFILSLLLIVSSYFIINLDFIKDKIILSYSQSFDALSEARYFSTTAPTGISVGRFAGFYLDIENFIKEPFLGYGSQIKDKFQGISIYMMSGNGISGFLVRFGILGVIFFTYSLRLTLIEIKNNYSFRYIILPISIIILPLASNPPDFIVTPFIWSILLLGYSLKRFRLN